MRERSTNQLLVSWDKNKTCMIEKTVSWVLKLKTWTSELAENVNHWNEWICNNLHCQFRNLIRIANAYQQPDKDGHKYWMVQEWERKAHRLSDPWPTSKNWTVAWSTITSPWWTRKWLCQLSALPMIVKGRDKPTPAYFGQSSTYGQGQIL